MLLSDAPDNAPTRRRVPQQATGLQLRYKSGNSGDASSAQPPSGKNARGSEIQLHQVLDRRQEIDTAAEVVVHCRSGARSAGAIRQLRAHGYDRLTNLKGGIKAWAEEIDPSMATY